jgi:hypothetical protein
MVKKRGDRCSVEGCGRTVHCLGLCSRCYSSIRYWMRKRSMRKLMSRAHDLEVWRARLDTIMGGKKVVTLNPRQRRRRAA